MKKTHIRLLALLMIFFIAFSSVSTPQTNIFITQAEAAAIKLSNASAVVPIGMYKKITVKGTSKKALWHSSDKTVATVSSSGVVIGRKAGTATITAKAAGKNLKCRITVIDRYNARQVGNAVLKTIIQKHYKSAYLVDYERTGNNVNLMFERPVGEGYRFEECDININTGKGRRNFDLQFFAKVPRTFTVWSCKKSGTGKNVKVTKVRLSKSKVSVAKGKTVTLKATAEPYDATNKKVRWTSSNTKIATVTQKGLVKGIKPGTATITARAADGSGKKAACKVTVTKTKVDKTPNVTFKIGKMTPAKAAKALGLTKRTSSGSIYYYTRKNRKPKDGSPYLSCSKTEINSGKIWNLEIPDKTIACFGAKVGMSRSKAYAALSKYKWKWDYENFKNKNESVVYYVSDQFGECKGLEITLKNNIVKKIAFNWWIGGE